MEILCTRSDTDLAAIKACWIMNKHTNPRDIVRRISKRCVEAGNFILLCMDGQRDKGRNLDTEAIRYIVSELMKIYSEPTMPVSDQLLTLVSRLDDYQLLEVQKLYEDMTNGNLLRDTLMCEYSADVDVRELISIRLLTR